MVRVSKTWGEATGSQVDTHGGARDVVLGVLGVLVCPLHDCPSCGRGFFPPPSALGDAFGATIERQPEQPPSFPFTLAWWLVLRPCG